MGPLNMTKAERENALETMKALQQMSHAERTQALKEMNEKNRMAQKMQIEAAKAQAQGVKISPAPLSAPQQQQQQAGSFGVIPDQGLLGRAAGALRDSGRKAAGYSMGTVGVPARGGK